MYILLVYWMVELFWLGPLDIDGTLVGTGQIGNDRTSRAIHIAHHLETAAHGLISKISFIWLEKGIRWCRKLF